MTPITSTLHNHTTLCDGKSTPEEMVEAAIAKGFTDFGISCHSYMEYEAEYTIKDEAAYIQEINALKKKYEDRIRVWLGIEQDYFSPIQYPEAYSYLIASVHTLQCDDGWLFAVDGEPDQLQDGINRQFGGDGLAMTEAFYRLTVENAYKYRPDIIGHFDLCTKFNRSGRFFDEQAPRYRRAALEALDACCELDRVFEVNTGAIARGFRDDPYPARFLLEHMNEKKARLTLSADAHHADSITCHFAESLELLRDVGFRSLFVWENGAFTERGL